MPLDEFAGMFGLALPAVSEPAAPQETQPQDDAPQDVVPPAAPQQ